MTLDATRTDITLVYADGQRRIERPDTPGDSFGAPRLSADRRTAGWTVDRVDGASYAVPEWLRFVQNGAGRTVACDAGVPWAWRFEGSDRVVIECGFPHGPAPHRRVLVVIATGHIIGSVAVPNEGPVAAAAPAWARHDLPER